MTAVKIFPIKTVTEELLTLALTADSNYLIRKRKINSLNQNH